MSDLNYAKPQNWTAAIRARSQEPEPTLEERLRALEAD